MSRQRIHRAEFSPAGLGSLALHAAVALALMFSWGARDLKVGSVVPVNIVASGPSEPTPAIQDAQTQTAQAEEVSQTPPEPAPAPTPPPPTPTPQAAKPAEKAPAPTPTKPAAAKPAEKALNLDSLYASLTVPNRNRPSANTRGPARPETAPVARSTNGFSAAAGTEVSAEMQGELEKNWIIDCSLSSTRDVVVRTYFTIGAGGRLAGDVEMEAKGSPNVAVLDAAKFRARQAVLRSQPFTREPRENWGRRLYADFNAREYCSRPSGA